MARPHPLVHMYADIERHEEMLKRGRELYNELQQIKNLPDFIPSDEQDFIHSLRSEYDCLREAIDHFESKETPTLPSSPPTDENITALSSKIEELTEAVTDDGLKEITISDATETYYHWYIQDQKENKNKDVPPKTQNDKERTLKTFSIILDGNRLLKELNQEIIEKEYVAKSKRIPLRLGNIYSNPPNRKNVEILTDHLDEIVRIGITEERKSKSRDTLNREYVTIKMFLSWAEERFYVTQGLGTFIPSISESTLTMVSGIFSYV